MPKVSVIVVEYNTKKFVKPVFDAILAQTHTDLEIFAVVNSDDGTKELIHQGYPSVKVIYSGTNLGFAGGNNLAIHQSIGEFIQLVNPDLVMEPDYIERMLKAFNDSHVAAATGKLLRYDFSANQKTNIIDSTGITMSTSGRGRDRGQNQIDTRQFDHQTDVFGVSGAAPMYRKSALERVKYCKTSPNQPPAADEVGNFSLKGGESCEYFDEDFVAYWEDVDLSWRLRNANYVINYVPGAVAYHGRTAGQSAGGYLHLYKFIRHHKQLNPQILKWNYKNHILMYIKNAKFIFNPAFILRELAMLGYIIIFETSTLKVLPELFRQIPKIWAKRKAGTH